MRAPTKIRSYLIEKTIGKGNFAVVKCARHAAANVKVRVIPTLHLSVDFSFIVSQQMFAGESCMSWASRMPNVDLRK